MNKSTRILPFLLAGFLCAAPLSASPLLSVGENGDVFFQLNSVATTSDNIFLSSENKVDDVTITVTPSLIFDYGRGATALKSSLRVGYSIIRYIDNSEFDLEAPAINWDASYAGPRYTLSANAGYDESQRNEEDRLRNRSLVKTENTRAGASIRYTITPRSSFRVGVSYDDLNYKSTGEQRASNRDRTTVSVPVDYFHELTPRLDGSIGFRYRANEIERFDNEAIVTNNSNTDDYFFNVGLTGDLTAKLTTTLRLGLQIREYEGDFSNDETFTILSTWKYDTSPSTFLEASLNRDFAISAEGSSTERTGITGTFYYIINPMWNANATASYTYSDYLFSDRTDDIYRFRLGVNYRASEYWAFSAGYLHRFLDSNVSEVEYTENSFTFSANFRY